MNEIQIVDVKVAEWGVMVGAIIANVGINQTGSNAIPVVGIQHVALQPVGEVRQPVLLVPSSGHHLPHPFVGHQQREDGESDEPQDDEEDEGQVDVEDGVEPTATAHQAQEGEHQEGQA